MRRLASYFAKGLLFLAPFLVTIYVIVKTFLIFDGYVSRIFHIKIPGVGFAAGVLAVTLIGFLTSNIFAQSALLYLNRLLQKVPFVRLLYNSITDLTQAFVGKKRMFNQPVVVTVYPQSGGKAVGFITTTDLKHFGLLDHVAVYFPQSYNFAGQVLLFPREQITPIENVAGSEIMTFIVSAGVAGRHGTPGGDAFDSGKKA
jgi:uncharacterized membrane protein